MKPAQWIGAVLAGAAMVFVITFALNYVGNARTPDTNVKERDDLQLTFPVTQAPPGQMAALGTEVNKPDWYDYWFRNDNDRAVRVGLRSKNCKCSSVELYLLPADWQSRLPAGFDAANAAALGAGPAAAARQALAPARLAEQLKPIHLEQMAEGEVPPGGQGWVRLKWSGERPGLQEINAVVWSDNKEDGPTVTLSARVLYHAAAQASPAVDAGKLNVRQLEQAGAVTLNVYCWSATRPFRLEAAADTVRGGNPKSDPFVVGAPVPLSAAEVAKLEKQEHELPGSVRCAWRVPVTLRAVSEDESTPFELGLFHRWVKLTSPDEGVEPMRVPVTGRVVGDVTVPGEETSIAFGNFAHSRGTPFRAVTLESDTPGMELKLEEGRLPKYLEARLPAKPNVSASGHRTWRLEVRVRPGAARGRFPRQEDPAYADSAVYVQTAGKTPRSIRIPVTGTANDG
jgi:hypothetical protein